MIKFWTDKKQAAQIAKRIKANAQKWNLMHTDQQIFVHLSVGCATAYDADTMEKPVVLADEEMYRDKNEYYKSYERVRSTTGPR